MRAARARQAERNGSRADGTATLALGADDARASRVIALTPAPAVR
jgi:hypothetical protein